jgi:hypothetical protein
LRLSFSLGLWLSVSLSAGCLDYVSGEKFQATQRKLQLATEQLTRLENELAEQQQSMRTLQSQLARLRGLTQEEALEQLVSPVRLELEGLSGAYDTDGHAGDDGLLLFVRPIDRDGHVIKAAGTLRVNILDPLNPANRNVVAEYHFDVARTRALWYGRLWTQHFTVRCPWPTGQIPMHDELTAHVLFTDLLTGRTLTTQQAYKITLPPALPDTRPG